MSSQFEELFKARKKAAPILEKEEGSLPVPAPKKTKARKPRDQAVKLAKSDKNSDFEQTLVYLKKNTKREVKKRLLDDPEGRDFSDLVEELLTNWLKKK